MNHYKQAKRILIISFFFEPDTRVGGKRFSFLSKILQVKYPELHILTLKEKYIPQKDHSVSSAGTIHRAGMYPSFPIETNNIFKRFFNRLWTDYLCLVDPFSGWVLPSLFKGLKIVKANKINLIIATGPPFSSMMAAFLLSLMTRTKLILDYRDPWSYPNWKYRNVIQKKYTEFFEKLAIGRASALVFCSHIMMENFRNRLGKYTRATYHVITNGFHSRDETEPLFIGNGTRNMVYAGNFYGERSISLLADPLLRLLNDGSITKESFCFHVFGKTILKGDRYVIRKYGLEDVIKVHPQISYERMIRYLKCADILCLISGSDVRYALPFKIFDYLSVKRPILAVAPENSAVAEIMSQIDCGRLATIDNEDSILENLRVMIGENPEYSFSGTEQYTWDKIGHRYIEIIDRI